MSVQTTILRRPTRRNVNGLAWRLLPALPFVLILIVWTLGWAIFQPNRATLPPVSDVVEVVWARARDGELPAQIAASLQRLCLGAGVGILTGIIGGFFAGLYRNIAEFLNPLVVFFNAISGIVWLPLMIGWLGIGTALAVFVIWNTVFFIVFQNTVLGVQLVPEVLEQGVRALGGGRLEMVKSVILPGALPYVLTGIRSGLGFGWRALIAAELVGAPDGLGQMIFAAADYHRSDIIIAGCLIIGLIAIGMDRWLLIPIERRTIARWGLVLDTSRKS